MCRDKDGKFYFLKTRLRQFRAGRRESRSVGRNPPSILCRGRLPAASLGGRRGAGQSRALPGSRVLPNPANKEEFTGNPRSEDLFFSFSRTRILEASSGRGSFQAPGERCRVLLAAPWGRLPPGTGHRHPEGDPSPGWDHRPRGQSIEELPEHVRFPPARAHRRWCRRGVWPGQADGTHVWDPWGCHRAKHPVWLPTRFPRPHHVFLQPRLLLPVPTPVPPRSPRNAARRVHATLIPP